MSRKRSTTPAAPSRRDEAGGGATIVPGAAVRSSLRRRWLFRLIAALAVPLGLLAGLEVLLRLVGYGYSTDFFRPYTIGGETVLVENDQFGLRFFPAAIARSPAPVVMKARKTPGTSRIFILGESAALGDPRPSFGLGRYLQTLLNARYPGRNFEVVNVAVTAINSHAILPIARECAAHDGDVWVLYLGNNEFVGPFGASTVFGPQAPAVGWVRARLALGSTRLGQALASWLGRRKAAPEEWTGLRMFVGNELAVDDPKREAVYRNFRANLVDIVRAGVRAGARVIVSAAAVNLRDCPPFASLHGNRLGADGIAAWTNFHQQAAAAQAEGEAAEARILWQKAVGSSPGHAESHYQLARLEQAGSNSVAAAEHFGLARDCDALPLRTDSRLRSIAEDVARSFGPPAVRWMDTSAILGSGEPSQVPGAESFYEHVHLTFDGNYRLALALAKEVVDALGTVSPASNPGEWLTQEACEERLGLTDWNRHAVVESIAQRLVDLPYTRQLNHAEQQQDYVERLAVLRGRFTSAGAEAALTLYREAIQKATNDHRLHENFAEFLELTGNLAAATDEWHRVRDLIPHHFSGWFQAGRLLVQQRKFSEARLDLETSLKLKPDLAEAQVELGLIAYGEGRPAEALRLYDEAFAKRPRNARIQLNRADALAMLKRRDEALAALRHAIRLRPSFYEARYLLGVELAVDKKVSEAKAEFEEVLRLRPDHVLAHLNLGMALAQEKRFLEALAQFEATLKIDPKNVKARQAIDAIKAMGASAR